MAELTEPSLGLSYGWDLGETEWKTGMDNNLIKIGATSFILVLDKDLTAPPGAESEGDTYIVGPAATGAWTGYDNYIAYFFGGAYRFYQPNKGWVVSMEDEGGGQYYFTGAAWVAEMVMPDGGNAVFGTTIGTQLGTSNLQKLAFYGNTPLVQPADANQAAIIPATATLEETATLTQELREVLVALGLMRGSA